jgi:RNA polymerase sigma factor (sigma-70 family)
MDNDKLLSLLISTSRGDRKAFEQIYQNTSSQLFAISLKMLKNRALAEEALQDAFVKIWHNASEYQSDKGVVISWMISIIRYRSLDILRHQKVRKEQDLSENPSSTDQEKNEFEPDPMNIVYDEKNKLVDCIEQLEHQQRQVIHLAYYKGLTHHEVVDHVASPLGTVKSWIRRGLQQLQRCLAI